MILEFHCSHFSFCLSLTLHIPSFFSFSNCQTLFIYIFFYILPQFMSLFLYRSSTTSQCGSVSFFLPYFLYPFFFLLSSLSLFLNLSDICLSFSLFRTYLILFLSSIMCFLFPKLGYQWSDPRSFASVDSIASILHYTLFPRGKNNREIKIQFIPLVLKFLVLVIVGMCYIKPKCKTENGTFSLNYFCFT